MASDKAEPVCNHIICIVLAASVFSDIGCSPSFYRKEADEAATSIIGRARKESLGKDGDFTVERPIDTLRRRLLSNQDLPVSAEASFGTDRLERIDHWPEKNYPSNEPQQFPALPQEPGEDSATVTLTLTEALQVTAANSRDYHTRKEDVYQAALDLDLEADAFRHTFAGLLDSLHTQDLTEDAEVKGTSYSGEFDWSKRFKTGAEITAGLALDLANLITSDGRSSFGILADATITVPLMRGAGRHIVTEPLTQAQRNVVYALYTLERFKRTLAVQVASEYLAVLQLRDQVFNEKNNYINLLRGTKRARRLADAGRLPEIQVDQSRQDALRARNRWISVMQNHAEQLDRLKITMGLPTDAAIDLDPRELERLVELAERHLPNETPQQPTPEENDDTEVEVVPPDTTGGSLELPSEQAIRIALKHRLDLQTASGMVYDAQRQVVVAANALEMGLSLTASGQAGARRTVRTAGLDNARLRPEYGVYTFGLELDLPFERTAEQNAYRNSYITLERNVRAVQELEDQIKLSVRNALRTLLEAREAYRIQSESVALAKRRVESTELFLQAGRAEIRDVLEAQEALVQAQNALSAALVNYRIAELELQRDMGVLQVSDDGIWHEFQPPEQTEN